MSLTKKVVPTYDSRSVDVSMFDNVEVYHGDINGEIFPKDKQGCFAGAWYRKVMSSKDHWLGIEGLIQLGEFIPDEARFNLDGFGRYMDNPSVYMGGNSLKESDAGLGMNISYLDDDFSKELTMSSPKICFRPFWRYIYNEAEDTFGNVRRREVNSWNISEPKSVMYYYFPGDILRMKIYSPMPNYLQLRIEVVKPTTNPKYVQIREKYHLKDNRPSDFYSPIFHSEGHGLLKADFKRVNSIDQYGNEGFVAKPTNAEVSEATWFETFLYRKVDHKIVKVPFNTERQVSLICPNEKAIKVTPVDPSMGAEKIQIHPGKM